MGKLSSLFWPGVILHPHSRKTVFGDKYVVLTWSNMILYCLLRITVVLLDYIKDNIVYG